MAKQPNQEKTKWETRGQAFLTINVIKIDICNKMKYELFIYFYGCYDLFIENDIAMTISTYSIIDVIKDFKKCRVHFLK